MLQSALSRLTRNWTKNPGVIRPTLAKFLDDMQGTPIPSDYLALIRRFNGGHGKIGETDLHIRLWPIQDLLVRTRSANAPAELLLFGEHDANTALAFVLSARTPRVVAVDTCHYRLSQRLGAGLGEALLALEAFGKEIREWESATEFVRNIRLVGNSSLEDRSFLQKANVAPEDYIGFVPTPMKVVRRMAALAEIEPGDTVYDLGCGDGRILICAAREYSARGVGIDIDRVRIKNTRTHIRQLGLEDRILLRCQNVFRADLRAADVIMLYLLPALNEKLLPRLQKLKAGVRIVSHSFELPGMTTYKVARLKAADGLSHAVFAYRTPLVRI